MSQWQGFLTESKSFMNYEGLGLVGRIKFWLQFPDAQRRYYESERRDLLKAINRMGIQAKYIVQDQSEMHPAHKMLVQMIANAADAALAPYDIVDYIDYGDKNDGL